LLVPDAGDVEAVWGCAFVGGQSAGLYEASRAEGSGAVAERVADADFVFGDRDPAEGRYAFPATGARGKAAGVADGVECRAGAADLSVIEPGGCMQ
jgi:hypothetical protein